MPKNVSASTPWMTNKDDIIFLTNTSQENFIFDLPTGRCRLDRRCSAQFVVQTQHAKTSEKTCTKNAFYPWRGQEATRANAALGQRLALAN